MNTLTNNLKFNLKTMVRSAISVFHKVLTVCLLCLGLNSCIPEPLLIEVAPAESQLVVASQILPGDVMVVFLTRSFSALEGNDDSLSSDFLDKIIVENADVSISFGGQTELLSPIDDVAGVYLSDSDLDFEDAEIRLDVFDPSTNQRVHATTTVLPQITPDSVAFIEEVVGGDTTQSLYYSFTDPTETSNWYVINGFDPEAFASALEDNPLSFVGGDNGTFYEELISDQEFTDPIYEQLVELEDVVQSDTIAVLFSNISEGYFRFLDARQRTGGIIASATSEPINFPSNIVGGLGYFNAQLPSVLIAIKEE